MIVGENGENVGMDYGVDGGENDGDDGGEDGESELKYQDFRTSSRHFVNSVTKEKKMENGKMMMTLMILKMNEMKKMKKMKLKMTMTMMTFGSKTRQGECGGR